MRGENSFLNVSHVDVLYLYAIRRALVLDARQVITLGKIEPGHKAVAINVER